MMDLSVVEIDLKSLYASASSEPWHCLSILSPAAQNGGLHWVLRFMDTLTAKLETGEDQVFTPEWIDLKLPQSGATGQQQLQFSVSNVNGQLRRFVESVRNLGGEVGVVYRAYVPGMLDAPARIYRMTAISVGTKQETGNITAVFKDSVNASWPRITYTQARFFGLRFIGG